MDKSKTSSKTRDVMDKKVQTTAPVVPMKKGKKDVKPAKKMKQLKTSPDMGR
jgi:hypothetical protein